MASEPSATLSDLIAFVSAFRRAQDSGDAQQSGFIGYSTPEVLNTTATATSASHLYCTGSTA